MAEALGSAPRQGQDVLAAGAVLWRNRPGGVEVALIHRPRYDDWSLPKGKLDHGESMPAAAVREVAEETGWTARLGPVLGDVRYAVPEGRKTVRYWAAEALTSTGFTPGDEVDELRWTSPDRAAEELTYAHDVEVLRRFTEIGLPDSLVLLVRHAKAGSRAQWEGDDDLRPLSGGGREQAEKLRELLTLHGPDRILTAPPLRCRESVLPLARALGLPVGEEPLLGEDGYADDPQAALERLLELAEKPGVTVVCSQGGAIPGLLGALARRGGSDLGFDTDDIPSKKGSTWVLGMRDGELVTADYHARPSG
ncbi:MAG TPA: NUDIX hydrolase [Pseudonocardia sp.]|nr:NUDIX hydrolase [Pseudonocardia sp.]